MRALAVAGQVQGHVLEAMGLAQAHDLLSHTRSEQSLELAEVDLDPRDRVVPAHPELAEAEGPDRGFEPADLRQAFGRHRRAVGDPTRQACRRGLVPHVHADQLRGFAHFGFGHLGLDQRAPHRGVLGGLEPGSEVTKVVEVGAVDDVGEAPLDALELGDVVQLALAVKAAIGFVGDVTRTRDLVGVDEAVRGPELLRNAFGVALLAGGQARAHRRHANGALAEFGVGHGQHERAVEPARIADQHGAEIAQVFSESCELFRAGLGDHLRCYITPRRSDARVRVWRGPCRRPRYCPRPAARSGRRRGTR